MKSATSEIPLLAIHLAGARVVISTETETQVGDSLGAGNTFANPHAISVKRGQVDSGLSFEADLPAHSVSVITVAVEA